MAHEIGHVASGDMVTLALIQGVRVGLARLFASHPPIDERIAALQNRTYA